MAENIEKLIELELKLEALQAKHNVVSTEINMLRVEIERLKLEKQPKLSDKDALVYKQPISAEQYDKEKAIERLEKLAKAKPLNRKIPNTAFKEKEPLVKLDLEKFIGENLVSKIGIIITIIGVAIGAKYSIENELVSPLTRIILGYIVGIGLLVFGIKLKDKYESYSAVLVSGAISIMYFITYFAHSFYGLIPQVLAFFLMVVFTAFTVVSAINYNKQIIAHIGLVGAYAVPFLLSSGSGQVAVLFSYMAVINVGILIISFKKYWKSLFYNAFVLTWLAFSVWMVTDYSSSEDFALSLSFLSIYFIIFYITFMAYKILKKEQFARRDILMLLANSFIFFGFGYAVLSDHTYGSKLLGVFALVNAIIHYAVSTLLYRLKLGEKNLFYMIIGLVLVFITIAIPVQLNGNWVTLLWIGEAALLFWIGRSKAVNMYEKMSYPLLILAVCSLIQDWGQAYGNYSAYDINTRVNPIFNIYFLSSLLFIVALAFINFTNQKYKEDSKSNFLLKDLIPYILPAFLLIVTFLAPFLEIANYYNQLLVDSSFTIDNEMEYSQFKNTDFSHYKAIWLSNYSMLFVSILAIVNLKKLRNNELAIINVGFIGLAILAFLISGLFSISMLRDSYLEQTLSEYYNRGLSNLVVRYVSFSFLAILLLITYQYLKQSFFKIKLNVAFEVVLHITILWVLSSELINWMDIAKSEQSYKLGLSILWGIYALAAIALGIWKNKKHLRIGAFALFGITLLKLFFYDISHLNTISKTIVFVSLGVLLLVASFLYNKYKNLIIDDKNV